MFTRTMLSAAAVAIVSLGFLTPVASAAPAHPMDEGLVKASVRFHTTDNDKDHDSHVTVYVKEKDGTIAARADSDYGQFPDNSDNGPFALQVLDPATRDDFAGGQAVVRIDPKGNDTWQFTMYVELDFANGRIKNFQSENLSLSEDGRQQTFPIQ
jgi:hypothetical protein